MPWEPEDRLRIVDALRLDMTADRSTSILVTLMNQLTSLSPTRIPQIQDLLLKIEALQDIENSIEEDELNQGTIKSRNSYLEGSITYQDNLAGITDSIRREKMGAFRQRIRRYLDPYGYLARYNGVGRAIDAV